MPTAGAGALSFTRPGTETPLYELSPEVYQGLVGEQPFAQEAAKRTRVSELESAFRTQQQAQQLRQLTL